MRDSFLSSPPPRKHAQSQVSPLHVWQSVTKQRIFETEQPAAHTDFWNHVQFTVHPTAGFICTVLEGL